MVYFYLTATALKDKREKLKFLEDKGRFLQKRQIENENEMEKIKKILDEKKKENKILIKEMRNHNLFKVDERSDRKCK
jgi:hypothetical protein